MYEGSPRAGDRAEPGQSAPRPCHLVRCSRGRTWKGQSFYAPKQQNVASIVHGRNSIGYLRRAWPTRSIESTSRSGGRSTLAYCSLARTSKRLERRMPMTRTTLYQPPTTVRGSDDYYATACRPTRFASIAMRTDSSKWASPEAITASD